MSRSADQAQTPANFAVRNIAGKRSKQAVDGDSEYLPEDKLREICEKHYNQILPIMTEKVHREKLQGVQTRLTYGESSHRNSQTREETQLSESESCDRRRRPKKRKPSMATASRDTRPSQKTSVFSRLRREGDKPTRRRSPVTPRRRHASERMSASSNRSAEDSNRGKKDVRSNLLGSKKLISLKMRTTRVDTGSLGLRNVVPKKTRMPANVKTYDETGDLEDHLKIFQADAKIEQWAMPTWCHVFNSTLIGLARVWFDKLLPESIDKYEILRKAFLGNFSQQKKYIKDPVEIHHIKRNDERDNNLSKGEVAAANQSRKKVRPMRQDRFAPLIKTPKEILAMETVKFKAPSPMTGPVENRNKNKFCEFHGDKSHSTDECIHLRRQIEEAVRSRQLSHLVKEIKQGGKRGDHTKATKKGKLPTKRKLQRSLRSNPGSE
ncbi:hypothetical protein Tco_1493591 [Tanacetum coccineum]